MARKIDYQPSEFQKEAELIRQLELTVLSLENLSDEKWAEVLDLLQTSSDKLFVKAMQRISLASFEMEFYLALRDHYEFMPTKVEDAKDALINSYSLSEYMTMYF